MCGVSLCEYTRRGEKRCRQRPVQYLQLKHRRVYGLGSVAFEAPDDGVEHLLPYGHLFGAVVPGSLATQEDMAHQAI